MGSQEKAADPPSFEAWALKMPFKEYIVQYKMDGASLELQYEEGHFVRAVTRGDGKIGDDITENVLKMKGLIKEIIVNAGPAAADGAKPFSGGIRCEVIMLRSIHKKYFKDKANCRNAANGLMKKKNGELCEHLNLFAYDAVQGSIGNPFTGDAPFKTESENSSGLKKRALIVLK